MSWWVLKFTHDLKDNFRLRQDIGVDENVHIAIKHSLTYKMMICLVVYLSSAERVEGGKVVEEINPLLVFRVYIGIATNEDDCPWVFPS